MRNYLQYVLLLAFAVILAAVIFLIDIHLPHGATIGALYSLVIIYTWLVPNKYASIVAGTLCTLLLALSLGFKGGLDLQDTILGLNNLMSLIVIWICSCLLFAARNTYSQLDEVKEHLEETVLERTAQLQSSEARIRHMVTQVEEYAIIFLDVKGIVKNWNSGAKKIFGYNSHEILGKSYSIFFQIKDKSTGKPSLLLDDAIKSGSLVKEDFLIRKNGQLFWSRTAFSAIYDDARELLGYSLITHDLTRRKEKEERDRYARELEIKNKEVSQFAYVASHDLQEPLRTVKSFTKLLLANEKLQDDKMALKYAEFITGATSRMQELISGLLDYSKIGANANMTKVDLNLLVSEVIKDLDNRITETEAQLHSEKLPIVKGYKVELRLLFQNLISNAIKFRNPEVSPEIKIKHRIEGNCVIISICDNGIGISPSYHARIFQLFQRLHSSKEYKGTGIGLAHCVKIVGMHGGKIWVESEENEGSTFFFSLLK